MNEVLSAIPNPVEIISAIPNPIEIINVVPNPIEIINMVPNPIKTLKEKIIEKIQEKFIPRSIKVLVLIGGIYAGIKSLRFSWSIFSFLTETIIPGYNLKKRYRKHSWALITNASNALGRAFAVELGREGFNIILVGPNFEQLRAVSNSL